MRSKLIKSTAIAVTVTAVVTTAALLSMAMTGPDTGIAPQEPGQVGQTVYNDEAYVVAYNPYNLIRFHVIANSDSERDQALKRRVRDVIVREMTPELHKAHSLKEARSLVRERLAEIEALAGNEVKAWGEDYPVRVDLGRFKFPIKSYGELTLPAGEYEAVRVVIGQGQGANWWCVLFPPLCFVDVSKAAGPPAVQAYETSGANMNRVEEVKPEKNVKIRFKIQELISSWLN